MNEVYNGDKKKEVMYYISYTNEENNSKTNGSVKAKSLYLSFWMFPSAASHPIAIAFGSVVAHHSWEYVV